MVKEKEQTSNSLTGVGILLREVDSIIETHVRERAETMLNQYKEDIDQRIKKLDGLVPTIILDKNKQTHEIKGLKHKQLNDLIALVGSGLNVMITGQAGTGKTKSAEQVAEALGFAFYCMSVGSQTSKSDLLGYMDANGKYVSTIFRQAYEKGGVFVMDEIDAGNSNVLIVLNSALSNGLCAFPDGMVKKHDDFRFIATANTYGNGADRVYVGRNQLDGATLDRFAIIDWQIDEDLEERLTPEGRHKTAWLSAVRALRDEVRRRGLRIIVSPRASIKGMQVLNIIDNFDLAFNTCIAPQVPQDSKYKLYDCMKMAFKNASKGKPNATTNATSNISAILDELPF